MSEFNPTDPTGGPAERDDDIARHTRQIWIDRRPILVVLAARLKRQLVTISLFLLFFLLLSLEAPQGLSTEGYRTLCLFLLCSSLWVSNLLPLSITSLLAVAGIPLLSIMEADKAYAYFGNPVVFFVLGAFILGAAVVSCGLSTRIAIWVLKRFGHTPRKLVLSVFFLCAGLSCVMSEHAVAAMMFPIAVELMHGLNLRPGRSPMAKSLFFALAWGCIAGGTLTVLGGGRGPLAIGFLEEIGPQRWGHMAPNFHTITFVDYILYGLPLVVILLAVGWAILTFALRPEIDSVEPARIRLQEKINELGKTTWREQGVGIVLLSTIAAWVLVGHTYGLENIAMLGVGALFALRLARWREIEEGVNWGIVLTYGGAICLGSAMVESGLAGWFTGQVLPVEITSPKLFLLTIGVLVVLLTEFMSNSTVIAIMMPTALSLAPATLDPRIVVMSVVLPSNFAFMFPAATPATAMAYSSGTFAPIEAMRLGLLLDLAGLTALAGLIFLYWPAIGLL